MFKSMGSEILGTIRSAPSPPMLVQCVVNLILMVICASMRCEAMLTVPDYCFPTGKDYSAAQGLEGDTSNEDLYPAFAECVSRCQHRKHRV